MALFLPQKYKKGATSCKQMKCKEGFGDIFLSPPKALRPAQTGRIAQGLDGADVGWERLFLFFKAICSSSSVLFDNLRCPQAALPPFPGVGRPPLLPPYSTVGTQQSEKVGQITSPGHPAK